MNKIPETIYIQQFEDPELEGFQIGEDVTWCQDRVHEHDVKYVLAEKFEQLDKEVVWLKDTLNKVYDVIYEARGLTHSQLVHLPVKYQDKHLLGCAQDLDYWVAHLEDILQKK